MVFTPEPEFHLENEFQEALVKEIELILRSLIVKDFFIMTIKRFEICVLIQWINKKQVVKFLEVKHFSQTKNRIGFGNEIGRGSQVDLLFRDQKNLHWLNLNIHWAFGDASRPIGSKRFVLLNNNQAKECASNGVERGKQNNFTRGKVFRHAVTWEKLSESLLKFLIEV